MSQSPLDNVAKKVAESPARLVDDVSKAAQGLPNHKPVRVAKKWWGSLGPGLTTGASDDDPSGIATYSQAGAQFGGQFLWLSLYTIPFMIVAQEMCARIAHVTGRGISGVLKQHYPKWLVYLTVVLVFGANSVNIGADIAGMVAASQLIVPSIPYGLLAVGFTVVSLILQISLPYSRYERFLKILTLVLFAYVVTAFMVRADWSSIGMATLVPNFAWDQNSVIMLTAILGTTISPYLFYWQASQVIEQQKEVQNRQTLSQLQGTNKKEITAMRKDVATGMIFSNLVMFFIITVAGTVLFSQGLTITTAADAAEALRPLAGTGAFALFAIGIIGTGMLAIPVLAGSASYAFSEAFGLKEGLDKKLKQAYGFYGVIILSVLIGLIINFLGIDPIKALIFSAVLNGLIAPILLVLIMLVGGNKSIMGKWKNGPVSTVLGWLLVVIMTLAGIATLFSLFR